MVLCVGTCQVLYPKLFLESHLAGHSSTHCFRLPVVYPNDATPVCTQARLPRGDNFSGWHMGRRECAGIILLGCYTDEGVRRNRPGIGRSMSWQKVSDQTARSLRV